jgi:hypothetical protein
MYVLVSHFIKKREREMKTFLHDLSALFHEKVLMDRLKNVSVKHILASDLDSNFAL